MRIPLVLAALSALAVPCMAQSDLWVDPVSGSDLAAGTESSPLRTIGRAMEVAVVATTVHLQPGVYESSSGETFPLSIGPDVAVEAVAGKSVTRIHGAGNSLAWLRDGSILSGVTLTSTGSPRIAGPLFLSNQRPVLRDCDLIGGATALWSSHLDVESCRLIAQTSHAVELYSGHLKLVDCELTGTGSARAISAVYFYYDDIQATLELTRCKITGYGLEAIRIVNDVSPSVATLTITDTLIASNGAGIYLSASPNWPVANVLLDGSTIAGNTTFGFDGSTSNDDLLVIQSSIIAGHPAGDVLGGGDVESSLIGDGSAGAGSGALSGDPRFVDPAAGDWTLRFDSPCIDRAHQSAIRPDLAGRWRVVDGDLDLVGHPDMGAFEHCTLTGPAEATIGQSFELGVTGPTGGFSAIIVGPGGYAAFGASTVYGRLFIELQGSYRLVPTPTSGGAPTMVDLSALLDPAWIGTSIGFQALPRSAAAPAGGAFSNPLLIPVR